MRRIMLLAGLFVFASVACSLFASTSQEDIQSAVETSIAQTDAARVTDTPIPTDTLSPTDTPAPTATLSPTDTLLPPTKTSKPTDPPTDLPKLAYVEVTNRLGVQLTVKLRGPEIRTFKIAGQSQMTLEIMPGEYSYTLSAKGYNDLIGTITFHPGDNTWRIGKANP